MPLLLFDLLRGRQKRLRSYALGGGFELKRPEVALLIFSSTMFAMAHVSSWDIYKMPPTFMAGLVLGYLFLRVGLYAAIMLHFTVDFLSVPIEVTQSLGVTLAIAILSLAWIAVGSCYFVYYATRVAEFILKKRLWPPRVLSPKPQAVMYMPLEPRREVGRAPLRPQQGFGFSCRYCGHTEARYRDGEFFCLRCGRKN